MTVLSRKINLIVIVCVLLAGFILRFHDIDGASLWLDEIFQLRCTRGALSGIWSTSPRDKPPLDYYLQWFFLRGGVSETRARMHACILGTIAILAIGFWAREMGGRRLALIAMLLALSSPVLVRFSREGRPYSLMIFSQCLFFGLFWRALRSRSLNPLDWVMITASALLCFWSLYWGAGAVLLCLIFASAWLLINGRRVSETRSIPFWKRGIVAPLICGIAFMLGILPLFFRSASVVRDGFFAEYAFRGLRHYALYLDIFACGYDWWQYIRGAWIPLTITAIVGFFAWALHKDKRDAAIFCLFQFCLLFFGVFYFYKKIDHWMEMRYTIAAFPPALLLFAMGIDALAEGIARILVRTGLYRKKIHDIAAIFLTLIPVTLLFVYNVKSPLKRIDWRGCCQLIKEEGDENALVFTGRRLDHPCMTFYKDHLQVPGGFYHG